MKKTYLVLGNDKDIKEISLADNDKAIADKEIQPFILFGADDRT